MQLRKLFTDGKSLLVRVDTIAFVYTDRDVQRQQAVGELIFRVRGLHPNRRGLSLDRFALALGPVEGGKGTTGMISVIGRSSAGILDLEEDHATLTVEVAAEVNYESLDRAHRADVDTSHYYEPVMEPAAGRVSGRVVEREGRPGLADLRVEVNCQAGGFDQVQAIVLELESGELHTLLPAPDSVAGRNSQMLAGEEDGDGANVCDPSLLVNRRRLIVQPVGFRSSATDATPSGSTAAAQFATAQTVWGKGCVEVQVRPIVEITDATLKFSSDLASIRASYTDANPDVIEAFFVQNSLPAIGGGSAGAIGVASCKVVVAEPNAGNPVLMAHELGHVLGLFHPGSGSNSDAGTVMAPTGSASIAGTQFVTHFMCTSIANPVLQTLTDQCCLAPDVGNHYIRDFPVDVGLEPSEPLPAGMTRYSMSNVWNRLTNTTGTFSPSTGPEHQHPIRFNPDGTTRTNFLFATVDQLQNFRVRDASVRFYLKHPGSGGGASNLQLLGEAPVPTALAVGVPQTVSVPWTIPSGTPQHSCVFAVVRSPAEPEGNHSALNWWQFEALSRADNDWAQRNLEISDTASNTDDANVALSSPFLLRTLPVDGIERLPVRLAINAEGASGLEALCLEVPGRERIDLSPGKRQEAELRTPLALLEDYPMVLEAAIPARAARPDRYVVDVDPTVGDFVLTGFSAEWRMSRPATIARQVCDLASSAFTDLLDATDLEVAGRLADQFKALLGARVRGLEPLARAVVDLASPIDELVAQIAGLPAGRRLALEQADTHWKEGVSRFEGGELSALGLVERFRSLVQRLVMSAAELLEWRTGANPDAVRVVLDSVSITRPNALAVEEFFLRSRVNDRRGHTVIRRFPESGYFAVGSVGETATLQLETPLYEAEPEEFLQIRLEEVGLDAAGDEHKLASSERTLTGGLEELRGRYVDANGRGGWRALYHVV